MTGGNGTGKPVTLALAGCGRISQVHLHAIANEPRVKLVAVVDTDENAAYKAAAAAQVEPYLTMEKMLAGVGPEAVVICTPPNTHRALAEQALAAGAHVLCEKPLTTSRQDAEKLAEAASMSHRILMMASKFRYVEDIAQTKGILDSGILGDVIMVENGFCSCVDMKDRWNARLDVAGGGVLIDNGSHSVDIIRYLCGPIAELQAIFGKQSQNLEVEDTVRLFVRCMTGVTASIDLSWSISKEDPYYIHVYGTNGTLEVGWKGSRYQQRQKPEWISFGSGYDKFQAVGAQLANFVDTIQGKSRPVISVEDAVESVRVIQKAYETVRVDRWQKVAA